MGHNQITDVYLLALGICWRLQLPVVAHWPLWIIE